MDDEGWMRMALEEARKGIGRTAPNPPVGAVVVREGKLLGKGWHRAAGMPHAELEALKDAGNEVRGATIYITLEPCSTHGRTPPCTQALIASGITRVVYACADRNPQHASRADLLLAEAGIEVSSGVGSEAAQKILRPFFKVQETGLPWVIWKSAMSLDGRITRPPGEGQWLTSEEARADVQRLRSTVDAILTSGETVRRDRPALTIRIPELLAGRLQPWRVIVSDRPESLPISGTMDRTIIHPRGDLGEILKSLASELGVLTVMVEAGGVFSAALLGAGLVDEAVIYYAPLLSGGPACGLAGEGLTGEQKLEEIEFRRFGDDVRMHGIFRR